MKLNTMKQSAPYKKMGRLIESRFGTKIDFDKLSVKQARSMLARVTESINSVRRTSKIHNAEKNPGYMEMLMIQEGLEMWLTSKGRSLMEDEISQAEVVIAAKSMVDEIQSFIKKVGEMQNEQLPALLDSIRGQIGSNEAASFKNAVGGALSELAQQLSSARESIDGGVRGLTGESVADSTDVDSMDDDFSIDADDADMDDAPAQPAPPTDVPRMRR